MLVLACVGERVTAGVYPAAMALLTARILAI